MTGARATNYGERIDYILMDPKLVENSAKQCELLPDVMGSDHCPVKAELQCCGVAANKCPPGCTKYWPEFLGKQRKMQDFFTKSTSKSNDELILNKTVFEASKKRTLPAIASSNAKRQKTQNSQKTLSGFFKKSNTDLSASKSSHNEVPPANVSELLVKRSSLQKTTSSSWKSLLSGPGMKSICYIQ